MGTEILSAWGAQLIAPGRYRFRTIRARYDTRRQTHAVGAEVWVVFREDLALRADDMDPPEKTFKLQPFLLQSEYDLALVDPLAITLQKRAYRPLAPLNLRVAGDGYNPTYAAGAHIVADWDQAANRSSGDPVTKTLEPDIDKTVLEVLTTGSHLLDEVWKDALRGIWKCTSAGTPGTWKQVRSAPVTADPSSGTIPTGYLILNATQGTLKRHAGSYDW